MNGGKDVQPDEERKVVSAYSREQAIDDGWLVDVSKTAQEAGFRYPVALRITVWESFVEVPDGVIGQDEAGRLWDILWMTRYAIRTSAKGTDTVKVRLLVQNDNVEAKEVELKAVVGPGDAGEPVITIMMPDED